MRINIAYDSSVFIDRSIDSVFTTIAEAVVLVVLVIFFFLRNLRATLIPLVTIPVSLVGSFALMYVFGFTINTLTLLAMVLAIGLVVDDAIVVLENIYRNIEAGMDRVAAAIKGIKEIGFAVIAMTLTLTAVFAPLAFATGRTGRLFIEFALALAGAVLVSGFVALTLSPMMCSKLLRHEKKHGKVFTTIEGWLDGLTRGYARSLAWVLKRRWIVVVVWFVVAGLGGLFFSLLRSELAPLEDRGVIFGRLQAPPGSTVDYTSDQLRAVEAYYETIPEAAAYNAIAGFPTVDFGNAILRLKPWEERTRKQQDIARELNAKFAQLPGVIGFAVNPPSLGQSPRTLPVEYVIMAQIPYAELDRIVQQFIAEISKTGIVQNPQSDLRLNTPELRVDVNRDKLGDLGISVETVGLTLQTMLGGRQVTRFKKDGEQYDVIVQVAPRDRSRPNDISDIYVRGRDGSMVQLANVVNVLEGVSPQSLNHFQRLRAVTITAQIAPGYALGDALKMMDETAKRVLPTGAVTDLNGVSREFRDSQGSIYLTFVLALIFIYLVLSAQFESFADPFVIMLSVPLSMTGALFALWATGGTWNIYSQIGVVTLVGLITKHGILIVEFANQLQERGEDLFDAVRHAAVLRLRPILMTTGAMVLGAVPLALSAGAGAESRIQIGWVIVGGMTFGTLLTLYVVPTMYTLMEQATRALARFAPSSRRCAGRGRAARRGTGPSSQPRLTWERSPVARPAALDSAHETSRAGHRDHGSRGQGRPPHHRDRLHRDRRPARHRTPLSPVRQSRARQRRGRARRARPDAPLPRGQAEVRRGRRRPAGVREGRRGDHPQRGVRRRVPRRGARPPRTRALRRNTAERSPTRCCLPASRTPASATRWMRCASVTASRTRIARCTARCSMPGSWRKCSSR